MESGAVGGLPLGCKVWLGKWRWVKHLHYAAGILITRINLAYS